jgi:hypothetical protein
MKKSMIAVIGIFAAAAAAAEKLAGVDEFVCSVSRVTLCFETGECFDVQPWEIDMPQFVVIDTKKKMIATTRVSEQQRSTEFANFRRDAGVVYIQGMEGGRAFSFVIDEATGIVTAAIARDGASVSVFGACTDADIQPSS